MAEELSQAPPSLLDRRLIIVTGKGGTGKTATAAALAEAARRRGRRVVLAETSAQESVAGLFESDPEPLGYRGRELRPGLHALRIDPHDALAEYLGLQIGLGGLARRALHTETFQQLLESAPGWRELITLGKVWHLEQKRDEGGRPAYDLVVVDAPATGHGLAFLDVPRVVQQAIRAGPLTRHASWVEAMVHDRERTVLLPVTLPEELPVLETLELVRKARDEVDVGVDRVVVNRVPEALSRGLGSRLEQIPDDLVWRRLPPVATLRSVLERIDTRQRRAYRERARVSELCELPVVDLPDLPLGLDAGGPWLDEAACVLADPVWPGRRAGHAAEGGSDTGSGHADQAGASRERPSGGMETNA